MTAWAGLFHGRGQPDTDTAILLRMHGVRLELQGTAVARETRLDVGERVRDVRQGPDGWLYLLTDSSRGRLLRVQP